MATKITYSIAEDTVNGKVSVHGLDTEIRSSPSIPDGLLAFVEAGVGGDPDVIQITLGRDLTQPESEAIDAIVAAHEGVPPEQTPTLVALDVQKDSKKRPFFIPWVTEGSRTTKISHRWNDPTTWVSQATQHEDQVFSEETSGEVYQAPHTNLIDVCHGKLWEEEQLTATHCIRLEVDVGSGWEPRLEVDPHSGDGDFTVNYKTGEVTFDPVLPAGTPVRGTYWKANQSRYILEPSPGKQLLIKSAEVQFSQDIVLTDTVVFETFGFVDAFAPHLVSDTPDYATSFPSGFRIPLRRTIYKTLQQFIDESNGAYPTIPAIGGPGWRGIPVPITVFPWNYAAALPLSSKAGMQVHIYCEHHLPFEGSYATATFYCLSEDED